MSTKVKTCCEEGCKKRGQPYYGPPGGKWEYCQYHKKPGMVRLDKQCEEISCSKPPAFGLPDGPVCACIDHREDGMVFRAGCYASGCQLPKVYGYHDGVAQYCMKHKKLDMARLFQTCEQPGCKAQPSYAFEGEEVRFCGHHRQKNMVYRALFDENRQCAQDRCEHQPRFGHPDGRAEFCDLHKLEGMVDLLPGQHKKLCQSPGCTKAPVFYFPGGPKRFCVKHKLPNMERYRGPMCQGDDCTMPATFAYRGQRPKKFCAKHKMEGMIPQHACIIPECTKWATHSYNFEAPRVCQDHREEGMTKKRRVCKYEDCEKEPYFGYEDGPKMYCTIHKIDGMVNKKNAKSKKWRKLCIHPGCKKSPHFRYPPGGPRDYCGEHVPGGTPSQNSTCLYDGCVKRRVWGYITQDAEFCTGHKIEGMVRLSRWINPLRPCEFLECPFDAEYGEPDANAQFCDLHKLPSMVKRDVRRKDPKPTCQAMDCSERALFGLKGEVPQFCEAHKEVGMEQLVGKKRMVYCGHYRCEEAPVYGFDGSPAQFCDLHKLPGMVLGPSLKKPKTPGKRGKRKRQCETEGCSEKPWYSFKGQMPRLCPEHKMQGMVLFTGKKSKQVKDATSSAPLIKPQKAKSPLVVWCEDSECTNAASYGFSGQPTRFCDVHKLEGMVNKKKKTNIKQICCQHDGCQDPAMFGYDKAEVTVAHQMAGMVFKAKKVAIAVLCEKDGCNSIARCGFASGPRRFCEEHMLKGMKLKAIVVHEV